MRTGIALECWPSSPHSSEKLDIQSQVAELRTDSKVLTPQVMGCGAESLQWCEFVTYIKKEVSRAVEISSFVHLPQGSQITTNHPTPDLQRITLSQRICLQKIAKWCLESITFLFHFLVSLANTLTHISYVGSKSEPPLSRKKKKKMLFHGTHSVSHRSHPVSQTWQSQPGNQWRKWRAWQLCWHPFILLLIIRDRHNMHGKLPFTFIYPHCFLQGATASRTLVLVYA